MYILFKEAQILFESFPCGEYLTKCKENSSTVYAATDLHLL